MDKDSPTLLDRISLAERVDALSAVTEGKVAIQLARRIVADPKVRFGKPVIEGTRVPVSLVVGKLGVVCRWTRSPPNMASASTTFTPP